MAVLQTPTNDLINKYIDQFNKDERYYLADQAIIKLFDAFPGNKKLEDILLKLSVINELYSTNILASFKMAKHIKQLRIDQGLKKGDPEVVRQIATGHGIRRKKNNQEINFYSFATKYCNWHNQNCYAIYDSFVGKVLMGYKRQDRFTIFRQGDLKNFGKFKKILEDFATHYNLTQHNLKEIDKFLWIYGKENFPAYYEKNEKSSV